MLDSKDFEIDWARAQDYEPLMKMLLECFKTNDPDHAPLEDIFPDVYQPSEKAVGDNLVCRVRGKIIGNVGVYPLVYFDNITPGGELITDRLTHPQ